MKSARWVIYDSYVAYETAKELAEEREMKKEAKDIKVRNSINDRNRRGRFCLFLKYNVDDWDLLLCCRPKKQLESKMKIGEAQMIICWTGQSCEETTAGDSQGKWK